MLWQGRREPVSAVTALREGSQSRVLGRYQQDERDSERMCGQQLGV